MDMETVLAVVLTEIVQPTPPPPPVEVVLVLLPVPELQDRVLRNKKRPNRIRLPRMTFPPWQVLFRDIGSTS
jgi:hypothetical protein